MLFFISLELIFIFLSSFLVFFLNSIFLSFIFHLIFLSFFCFTYQYFSDVRLLFIFTFILLSFMLFILSFCADSQYSLSVHIASSHIELEDWCRLIILEILIIPTHQWPHSLNWAIHAWHFSWQWVFLLLFFYFLHMFISEALFFSLHLIFCYFSLLIAESALAMRFSFSDMCLKTLLVNPFPFIIAVN